MNHNKWLVQAGYPQFDVLKIGGRIKHMSDLPVQLQAVLISAFVSSLLAWLIHMKATRPILVFIRRPDTMWRIKNIGKGSAFNIYFRQLNSQLEHLDHILYPIADGEDVPLGNLKYGEVLEVYFSDWGGKRKYKTTCKLWVNDTERLWFGWAFSIPKDAPDETRLDRKSLAEKKLDATVSLLEGKK
jgi:hypothetical protein